MDPSDLRAGLADRLAGTDPIDAETFNAACYMLSRSIGDISFNVPAAAALVRRLLRVVGRVVIDTGAPTADAQVWAGTQEMALQWIDEALADIGYSVQRAAPTRAPSAPADGE